MRLSTYGGMDPPHKIGAGGWGWGHEAVREHQYAVVDELARDYTLDGFELDVPRPSTPAIVFIFMLRIWQKVRRR